MFLPAQIIQKKRDGQALTDSEIRSFVDGFTSGSLPDYQMAALAMAICFQGLNFAETLGLTRAMLESGQTIPWTPGPFLVDKHSTGGIGDKTSLLLAPLLACCGVRVPMLSGRSLGPTGGTLDKLESIPGFRTQLPLTEFVRLTNTVGCAIAGPTAEIAPADQKLYALRDVTATVSCPALIVASILSKKLAENVAGLVLDVKWGSGAFMHTRSASRELAQALVTVAKWFGKKVVALQTDMNQPLGDSIGNTLEVRECLDILSGQSQPADLLEVTLALGVKILLVTNAAGGINPVFNPGDLMLIEDHINYLGVNPLIEFRENGDVKFLDMTQAYSTRLREKLEAAAEKAQITLRRGVYLATTGPSYETPAEVKTFAWWGADAVGMSTVPEVLLARYHNLEVAGISCITNLAAGISSKRLTHDEVLEVGKASQVKLAKLLGEFLGLL